MRTGRRLLDFVVAASLLACALAIVVWARSYWRGDLLIVPAGSLRLLVLSEAGLIFTNVEQPGAGPQAWRHQGWPHPGDWSPWDHLGRRWWDRLGFGHYVGGDSAGRRIDQFVVPYYFIAVVTALPPSLWLARRFRRRARSRAGRCRHCGYDLRASPERCPECGASSAEGPERDQTPVES